MFKQNIFNAKSKLKGFTINELLVVLIIIGIFILLVLPSLMPLIVTAKSTEAQLQLGHLHTLQKSHFYMYSKYSDDFDAIGFEPQALVTEEGKANYMIEMIEAGVNGFVARATAAVDFDGDGECWDSLFYSDLCFEATFHRVKETHQYPYKAQFQAL